MGERFVGRTRELRWLHDALTRAEHGTGGVALISGEPGIGKTSLVLELASRLPESTAAVVVRCQERGSGAPYWLWVQTIREVAAQFGLDWIRRQVGPECRYLAPILPALAVADDERLDGVPPDVVRAHMADALILLLSRIASERILALVLDDVHLADSASLQLLEEACERLAEQRALIVATCRDGRAVLTSPASETLGQLLRHRRALSIRLERLGQPEVAKLLRDAADDLEPAVIDAVAARTGGNPLFVTEALRLVEGPGATSGDRAARLVALPARVRVIISRRLNRLRPATREVLQHAALMSSTFQLRELQIACSRPRAETLAALDEAEAHEFLEEVEAGSFRFGHAIVQEAVASELTRTLRAQLHERIGLELEAAYGRGAVDHADQLVSHFAHSLTQLGRRKLVTYAAAAGEAALLRFGWEAAVAHFEAALRAHDGVASDIESAQLLFGLARAQAAAAQGLQALGNFQRAFAIFERAARSDLALQVASHPFHLLPGDTGVIAMNRRALELTTTPQQEGWMLFRIGTNHRLETGDYAAALEAFERAHSSAAPDNTMLRLHATQGRALALWGLGRYDEAIASAKLAMQGGREAEVPLVELPAMLALHSLLLAKGLTRDSDALGVESLRLADTYGHRVYLAAALHANSALHMRHGDWPEARRLSDRGLTVIATFPPLLASRATLEYLAGDQVQGDRFLQRLRAARQSAPQGRNVARATFAMLVAWRARYLGGTLHVQEAEDDAGRLAPEQPLSPIVTVRAQMAAGLLALQRHDRQGVAAAYGQLHRVEPHPAVRAHHFYRVLGILGAACGHSSEGGRHFEAAREIALVRADRPMMAWISYDFVRSLGGGLASAERRRLIDGAAKAAVELRMPLLAELVAAERHRSRDSVDDGALTLSRRELEVLSRVAGGASNAEVARALAISPHTVATHMRRILAKTNAANRAEAVAIAMESGLTRGGTESGARDAVDR